MMNLKKISIIVPCFNEELNIHLIYEKLTGVFDLLKDKYEFEVVFVNDGSEDNTFSEIEKIATANQNVHCIDFSRNFGKEIATTAGINHCTSDACIIIDADLQHPVDMIPQFIAEWENGAEVVVGIRKGSKSDSWIKRFGSKLFYKIMVYIGEIEIVPNSTDFRLLDGIVVREFNRLTEKNRMTRGLVAWLGFRQKYLYFDANERLHGKAGYSFLKLFKLAMSSFVSQSLFPLKFAGYLGLLIMFFSGILGIFIFFNKYVLDDERGYYFSGPAALAVLNIFLIGIVLSCLGLIALYIANIHREVSNRPLYVVRRKKI